MKKIFIIISAAAALSSCTKGVDPIYPAIDLSNYTAVNIKAWHDSAHATIDASFYIDYGAPVQPIIHPDAGLINKFNQSFEWPNNFYNLYVPNDIYNAYKSK